VPGPGQTVCYGLSSVTECIILKLLSVRRGNRPDENALAPPTATAMGVIAQLVFQHTRCGCYVPLTSGSMGILLSTDCLLGGSAEVRGVAFCTSEASCCGLIRWVNVFDAVSLKSVDYFLALPGRASLEASFANPIVPSHSVWVATV